MDTRPSLMSNSAGGKRKVLVVDDEPDMLTLLAMRLEAAGVHALVATDGAEALEIAKTQRPDLILLDLVLPKLNGYDVCAVLRHNPALQHIPIVMLTARTQTKDERAGFECGADAYVRKPFEPAKLFQLVYALLAASSTQGAIWPQPLEEGRLSHTE